MVLEKVDGKVILRITEFAGSISSGYYKYGLMRSFYLNFRKVSFTQLTLLFYGTKILFLFFVLPHYAFFITDRLTTNRFNAQVLSLSFLSKGSK
jgi:hypothetical protein